MTEQLTFNPEITKPLNTLPTGAALKELYALEFQSVELPVDYRVIERELPNSIQIDLAEPGDVFSPEQLKDKFLDQAPTKAYKNSWWADMSRVLEKKGANAELADNLQLNRKHVIEMQYDRQSTGLSYELFEVGEAIDDPDITKTAIDTIQFIDQMTGGFMAADDRRYKLVLGNGISMAKKGERQIAGYADDKLAYINLEGLKNTAALHNIAVHEILAAVIVHEILGHGLERRIHGWTGIHFTRHFDYSDERTDGDHVKNIHAEVTPKDPTRTNTQPVREYGRYNPAEDLATATEAAYINAFDLKDPNKIPSYATTPDSYRTELVMEMMEQAARMAAGQNGSPGFLGSELSYKTDPETGQQALGPRKSALVHTLDGQEAVQDEIEKVVKLCTPNKEIAVYPGDWIV